MNGLLARGDDGEQPLSPVNFAQQTLAATWDNLPQILVGALFLNLCSASALLLAFLGWGVPAAAAAVLLAAPGWAALQQYELALVQGKASPISTLWKAWRQFWARSVRLGALGMFLPAVTTLAGAALAGAEGSSLAVAVLTIGIVGSLLVGSLLVLYAVPLLVQGDHDDLALVLRDSLILAARHIGNTVGMVALAVLGIFATIYLSSGLIFVLPALYGMFVANNCRLVLQLEKTI